MHSFTDNANRVWTVEINVAAAKRVRAATGVDLYGLADDGLRPLAGLLSDVITLVDVIYVLCRPEADARGVSDEDFGRALSGDAIERAVGAFQDELTDFFPNPRARDALKRLIAAGEKVADRLMTQAEAELAKVEAEAETGTGTGIDELTAPRPTSTPNGPSIGSPAPSGSIPAP